MTKVFPTSAFAKEYLEPGQYAAFRTLHICLTLLTTSVLILALVNIWCILIKQNRWRKKPLFFFYLFTMVCVVTRLTSLIFDNFDTITLLEVSIA